MSDYIDQDVVGMILKQLGVRSILRCRSVCKSWKQMIDSRSFILDHLSIQRPLLLAKTFEHHNYLVIDPQTLPLHLNSCRHTYTFPIIKETYFHSAFNSVHGVICFFDSVYLYVWNPSIHRLVESRLPDIPACRAPRCYRHCSLWIDPCNNHTKIAIFNFHSKGIAIFSSTKPKQATQISMGIAHVFEVRCFVRQVLIHGVAYWIVNSVRGPIHVAVAYFDFIRDEFGIIDDVPSGLGSEPYTINVWKWKESLSLLHCDYKECSIWARQDGISWTKMITFNLFHKDHEVADVLFLEESLDMIFTISFGQHHLMLYDLKTGFKGIFLKSDDNYLSDYEILSRSVASEFVESLVFPDLDFISTD